MKRAFVAYGHFLFKARNWLFPVVLIPLCLVFPPVDNDAMHVLGVIVAVLGLAVRGAVIGLVYIKRGGIGKKIAAPELVTEGMFRHGRNPLYLGNLLIVAGILLVQNNPWTYLLAGTFFLLSYSAIVAAEEEFLRAKFGQAYADYCAHTPRWLIDPRGLGETLSGMRFNWQRVVSKGLRHGRDLPCHHLPVAGLGRRGQRPRRAALRPSGSSRDHLGRPGHSLAQAIRALRGDMNRPSAAHASRIGFRA